MKLGRFVLLTLTLALVIACSEGDECDTCTQDSDCAAGFVCSTFSDGSMRCGTGTGASTCRVRN
jgi:Cys-rich repeat protein